MPQGLAAVKFRTQKLKFRAYSAYGPKCRQGMGLRLIRPGLIFRVNKVSAFAHCEACIADHSSSLC